MPRRRRLVLFDLDGTLVDSAPDLAAAANHLRARRGLPPLPFEALREHCGKGARGLVWAGLRLREDAPGWQNEIDAFLSWYGRHLGDRSSLFAGVREMLDGLDGEGFGWGIVTNKAGALALSLCRHCGLADQALAIVGGDTPAGRKPGPGSILEGIRRAGFAPEDAVYVGDDLRDTMAAHAAGLPSLVACWGYTGGGQSPEQWGAEALLRRPDELAAAASRLLDGD